MIQLHPDYELMQRGVSGISGTHHGTCTVGARCMSVIRHVTDLARAAHVASLLVQVTACTIGDSQSMTSDDATATLSSVNLHSSLVLLSSLFQHQPKST